MHIHTTSKDIYIQKMKDLLKKDKNNLYANLINPYMVLNMLRDNGIRSSRMKLKSFVLREIR